MRNEITGRRKERVKSREDPRYVSVQRRYMKTIGKFLKRGHVSRLQIKELSEKSNVWKSTFYDHFAHMDDAISQFLHAKKPELEELYVALGTEQLSLTKIYKRILIFIYQNREYYDAILACGNYIALEDIINIFGPTISRGWSNYADDKTARAMIIFSLEFAGEIYFWGQKEQFDFDKISGHAKALAKLSENATQRLA